MLKVQNLIVACGLSCLLMTNDMESFQIESVVFYYPGNYDFTREKSDKTVFSFEYPQDFEVGKNDRIYPILNPQNQAIYNQYLAEAKKLPNVHFLGRLGAYRYYDMNRTIAGAFETFNNISSKR